MRLASVRGVNLGNWLVLEKWMEPSLFRGAGGAEDEHALAHALPPDQLAQRLKAHRDAYMQEEDFAFLAGQGVDSVRLPVPFFVFGDRPPYLGCIEYVDRAFAWAGRHGLTVLLDLHTVPGSQNGFDNGGQTGVKDWARHPEEVSFALDVLDRLAFRYRDNPALLGIEVLNEPILPLSFLRRFYATAYRRLRRILPPKKAVVFHDSFNFLGTASFFLFDRRFRSMRNVYLDTHFYPTFAEQGIEKALEAVALFGRRNRQRLSHRSQVKKRKPTNRGWLMGRLDEGYQPHRSHRKAFYRGAIGGQKRLISLVDRFVPVIVGEWCAESAIGKKETETGGSGEPDFSTGLVHLHRQAFPRRYFWSYQTERASERRRRLEGDWRAFWDWRWCREKGILSDI
ncbi:glycoside hydrolase family 5 protein [Parascardovia denticolens]|uniref:glycoside hydrolase family 5 protein n=1 Tax=Parascardovia denticolens TaxID=78258 RepID=UPI00248D4AA4|nr:cellulase family glycosylhydrolase [Parascardovia denticolens]